MGRNGLGGLVLGEEVGAREDEVEGNNRVFRPTARSRLQSVQLDMRRHLARSQLTTSSSSTHRHYNSPVNSGGQGSEVGQDLKSYGAQAA